MFAPCFCILLAGVPHVCARVFFLGVYTCMCVFVFVSCVCARLAVLAWVYVVCICVHATAIDSLFLGSSYFVSVAHFSVCSDSSIPIYVLIFTSILTCARIDCCLSRISSSFLRHLHILGVPINIRSLCLPFSDGFFDVPPLSHFFPFGLLSVSSFILFFTRICYCSHFHMFLHISIVLK